MRKKNFFSINCKIEKNQIVLSNSFKEEINHNVSVDEIENATPRL